MVMSLVALSTRASVMLSAGQILKLCWAMMGYGEVTQLPNSWVTNMAVAIFINAHLPMWPPAPCGAQLLLVVHTGLDPPLLVIVSYQDGRHNGKMSQTILQATPHAALMRQRHLRQHHAIPQQPK